MYLTLYCPVIHHYLPAERKRVIVDDHRSNFNHFCQRYVGYVAKVSADLPSSNQHGLSFQKMLADGLISGSPET